MNNRKPKDTEDILEFVKSKWKLSLQEFDVLESVLDFFQAGDKREIDKIEYLVNDETEKLLNLLSSYEIENYATEEFNLVSAKDEGDLIDALEDLNFNWKEKIDIDDAIDICEENGYDVLKHSVDRDIVSDSQFQEWSELFEEMTMQQRDLYINQIKESI